MKRDTRIASVLIGAISLIMVTLLIMQIWVSYKQTLSHMRTDTLNLGQMLDTYTEGVVRQHDLLLIDLSDRIANNELAYSRSSRFSNLLERQQKLFGQLSDIALYDTNGRAILNTEARAPDDADVSQRDFFIHHSQVVSNTLFISPPNQNNVSGKWYITLSRRISGPDGHFIGVIATAINIERFLALYSKLDIGRYGSVSLMHPAGILMARYPYDPGYIGLDVSDSPIFTHNLRERDIGTVVMHSRFDGVERIYAYHRNPHYGLITTVAVSSDEGLDSWERESAWASGLVLSMLGIIVFIGRRLLGDIRQRAEISAALSDAQDALLQANSQLKVMAEEDPLTGLANRRRFDYCLVKEVRRCARKLEPISLLLIDVDEFKKFNDAYGHPAGDACLRDVAESLKSCTRRPGDVAARYGGEELVVILPGIDQAGAQAVAERFMAKLADKNIPHRQSQYGVVTVSIGLVTVQSFLAIKRETQLIMAADAALYEAKGCGRNQIKTGSFLQVHF